MANTPVYTRGVKFIKVARIDASGRDNTTQLQNLTDIREVFTDINNPVQYNIVGINEYPTYYLYNIVPTDVTSSVDQEILNYEVSGSSTTTTSAGGAGSQRFTSYTLKPGTNTLGYFNGTNGVYTFNNTPNISINWTASITGSNSVWVDPDSFLFGPLDGNNNFITTVSPYILFGTGITFSASFSGSFTPIENQSYGLGYSNLNSPGGITGITNFQISITQSVAVQSSTSDITVLEPYIDEIFDGSDCDVLQNNADLNRFDSFFMEMDFTSGSILPQNQQAILNGSATRAQVQPWNYTYTSQVRSRYAGRQQNAIAVNVYTSASQFQTASSYGFSGSWPGDTTSPSLNGSIVVQQLDSCIYTTNWAGGGYPENSYGGIFSLNDILLIGENKDAVQVLKSDSPLYYQILNQNLPFSSSFIQRAYNPNNALSSQLTSLYPGVQLQDAAYWIPSNFNLTSLSPGATGGTFYPTGSPTYIGTPYLQLSSSAIIGIPTGIRNAANIQQTGSIALIMDPILEIMNKVASGSKWYMSFYSSSLGNIADGTDFNQYGYPFEITKVIPAVPSDKYDFLLKADASAYFPISNLPYSVYHVGYSGSQNNLGLLFTPGTPNQNQLVAYGDQWRDWSSDSGYLTLQYPKQVVTQNANYITKTYGNNPNP
jgi:hypothetical protein